MKNSPCFGPVALATCAAVVGREQDDLAVIEALPRRGIEAVHAVWNDPDVDWSSFRLVVVRSTWDYIDRRDDFLAWAESLPKVLNPASILRWNTDKRYLGDLAKAGLPVIPTRFLEPGHAFEPPTLAAVKSPRPIASKTSLGRWCHSWVSTPTTPILLAGLPLVASHNRAV